MGQGSNLKGLKKTWMSTEYPHGLNKAQHRSKHQKQYPQWAGWLASLSQAPHRTCWPITPAWDMEWRILGFQCYLWKLKKKLESHDLFRFSPKKQRNALQHYAKSKSLSQYVHQCLYGKCSEAILRHSKTVTEWPKLWKIFRTVVKDMPLPWRWSAAVPAMAATATAQTLGITVSSLLPVKS